MARAALLILCFLFSVGTYAQNEVMYHVFQRSFFDSNNDGNGDLEGIRQKLDYLQELGVTTILLTPLYQSDFYHNYFATDFEKIDPTYGKFKEYRDLVQEVHRRKMKIYQDVEMQYVTGKHPWFTGSYQNPASAYGDYLVYEDKKKQQPYYFLGISEFTTYKDTKEQLIVVNMKNPKVKEYTLKVLQYWVDPNGDGSFYDGVDGFRLDHMMDDLDNAGKLTNLFADFWSPVLASLKKQNPALQIVAEQANWNSYGYEYFEKGNVDRVFAFRLKQAITSFDKEAIVTAADSTFNFVPQNKQQVVFIENHDIKRFATQVDGHAEKLKVGAALNILIGGIPSLYYGQELGMQGEQLKGTTDGNDIPVREAFEWYAAETGPGTALWYKDTQWYTSRNNKPNDRISLEEQQADPNSLYNYYKKLLKVKRTEDALFNGEYQNVVNSNDNVFSFTRTSDKGKVLVIINLSGEKQMAPLENDGILKLDKLKLLLGSPDVKFKRGGRTINLLPYSVQVWKVL